MADQPQYAGKTQEGVPIPAGSKAGGGSYASDEEAKAKRKADAYRTKYRKSFAWKPPSKPGIDKDYDAFDPDAATPPPAPKTPKLSDMAK
jgi:hypothetical protein